LNYSKISKGLEINCDAKTQNNWNNLEWKLYFNLLFPWSENTPFCCWVFGVGGCIASCF